MIKHHVYSAFRDSLMKSLEEICITEKEIRILVCGLPGSGKRQLLQDIFGPAIPPKLQKDEKKETFRIKSVEIILLNIEQSDRIDQIIPKDEVNLIWYIVRSSKLISSDFHFSVLEYLNFYGPVALVIPMKRGLFFQKHLKKLEHRLGEIESSPFFLLMDEDITGIQNLLDWSIEILFDGMEEEFLSASQTTASLDAKREVVAKKIIPFYTSGAGAIGLIPIPISDALILLPAQIAMTVHIFHIYQLEKSAKSITGVVGSTILSQIGKIAASSIIKLIPGGAVAGAIINGSVAASFTWALGMAINQLAYSYRLSGENNGKSFDDFFNTQAINEQIEEFKEQEKEERAEPLPG